LPILNGIEATRRTVKLRPRPRVLVLSMHEDAEYVRRAISAGASGYLLKTAPRRELELALAAVIRGETWISPSIAHSMVDDIGRRAPHHDELTPRQREILQLIAEGHTTNADRQAPAHRGQDRRDPPRAAHGAARHPQHRRPRTLRDPQRNHSRELKHRAADSGFSLIRNVPILVIAIAMLNHRTGGLRPSSLSMIMRWSGGASMRSWPTSFPQRRSPRPRPPTMPCARSLRARVAVILDVTTPGRDGLDTLPLIHTSDPHLRCWCQRPRTWPVYRQMGIAGVDQRQRVEAVAAGRRDVEDDQRPRARSDLAQGIVGGRGLGDRRCGKLVGQERMDAPPDHRMIIDNEDGRSPPGAVIQHCYGYNQDRHIPNQ